MKNQLFVLDCTGTPGPTSEHSLETHRAFSNYVPSAKAGEAYNYASSVAHRQASDDYKICTLIEWLGGIDKVAELAREKLNWVMRDFACVMGSEIRWGREDFERLEKKREKREP